MVKLRWQSNPQRPHQSSQSPPANHVQPRQATVIVIEPPSSPNPVVGLGDGTTNATSISAIHAVASRGGGRRSSSDSSASSTPPLQANPKNVQNLCPRAHSTQGISRAKIKTVKLTVSVIVGYIISSAPFTCVQLWGAWGVITNCKY